MGEPEATGVVISVQRSHTADLDRLDVEQVRELLDGSFDDFTEEDWSHALGGTHVLVREDDRLVAYGALVPRRLLHAGRSLRTGYVEAVATAADVRRRGHGATVMAQLEALAPAYDLLALSASTDGVALYDARGWVRWPGRTSVLTPAGVLATPQDDGSVYVLVPAAVPLVLELDGWLTCDWRAGDVW